MARRLAELQAEAKERDLDASACQSKRDYERLLAIEADLSQIEVMKARDFKDLPLEAQEEILASRKWVAEEKIQGARMKVHVTKDGLRLDGGRISDETYIYTERTDNFPHLKSCKPQLPDGTVLDSEIIMPVVTLNTGSVETSGTLTATTAVLTSSPGKAIEIQRGHGPAELVVFDIIRWGGETRRKVPFESRRKALEIMFAKLATYFAEHKVRLIDQYRDETNKKLLFEKFVKEGGEGLMLKHVKGYYDEGKRVSHQYKWKKTYPVDGFISGYVPAAKGKGWEGLVGAFQVSVIDETGKERIIGTPQPGTLEFRKEITAEDGSLKKEYYDRVVEIQGNEWTKGLRLVHCVLNLWRPDKDKTECILDMAEIKRKWCR